MRVTMLALGNLSDDAKRGLAADVTHEDMLRIGCERCFESVGILEIMLNGLRGFSDSVL